MLRAGCYRTEARLHDGAGNRKAATLISVALDAFGLATCGLGRLNDGLDDGNGCAAGTVAVDEGRTRRASHYR